jgi:lysophospholipase L1-like esterase
MRRAVMLLMLFGCGDSRSLGVGGDGPSGATQAGAGSTPPTANCLAPTTTAPTNALLDPKDAGAAPDAVADDAFPDVVGGATTKPRAFVYGNSLVWGVNASDPLTTSFPARLAAALGQRWEASKWVGRSGWGGAQLLLAAKYDLPLYTSEKDRARKVFVFWEGTNELAAFPCDSYEIMTRTRIAEGWTVVLMTALPTTSTANDGGVAVWVQRRRDFNQCVRDNAPTWGAAAVVDVGALPDLQDPWDTSVFSDGVHLTDLGYQRIADAVAPVVESLYVAPTP